MKECVDCGNSFNEAFASNCPVCSDRRKERDLTAANAPGTSSDELGKLAMSHDPQVVEAAIANPNAPQWAKNRATKSLEEPSEPTPSRQAPQASGFGQGPSILAELRKQSRSIDSIKYGVMTINVSIGIIFLLLLLSTCSAENSGS